MNHELQAERTHNQSGFTLIELLVSISIIAILASVGMVVYSSTQKTARLSKRAEDLKAIQATLELYKTSTGQYPIAVNNFVCIPSILAPTYMPKIPTDPSDSTLCYQYQSDASGIEYKVASNPTLVTSGEMKQSDFLSRPTLVDPARDADASANCSLNTSGTVSGWAYYSGQTACTYVTSGPAPPPPPAATPTPTPTPTPVPPPPPPPPPAGPSLVGPTGKVNKGTSVNVSWNDVASPLPKDWIAVFVVGSANTNDRGWLYINCTQTSGAAPSSGTCIFPLSESLVPGQYEFRYLLNDGFTSSMTSGTFNVQ